MSFFGGNEQVETLTRGQKTLLNEMVDQITGQMGQGAEVYGGTVTPDANASQLAAFNYAPGMLANAQQVDPAIQSMLAGQSAIGVDPEAYYQEAVYAPAMQQYADMQKQLEAQYGGSWGQTGGYQDIMQENAARFGTGLAATMAELAYNERDVANQQRAMGVDASFGQTNNLSNTLQTMLGVGAEQRGIAGQQLAEDYSKWEAGQAYNNPWLGFYAPSLGVQAFGIGQNEGTLGQISRASNMVFNPGQAGGMFGSAR